jgi:hypothetical protein
VRYFLKVVWSSAFLTGALASGYYGWRLLPEGGAFGLFFLALVGALWGALIFRSLLSETS